MEEHRFDQCRGVLFSEIFGVITCRRVPFSEGAERHIRWILAGFFPCEVESNEGRVDGRIEGRIGVNVESEVVLKRERNNEGACDMLC